MRVLAFARRVLGIRTTHGGSRRFVATLVLAALPAACSVGATTARPDTLPGAADAGPDAEAVDAHDAPGADARDDTGGRVIPVQLAAGGGFSCARMSDATVRCWGSNGLGELGDGTTDLHATPTLVPGLAGAVQVALGASHGCARFADGTVRCWGYGAYGELGEGGAAMRAAPHPVAGITDAVEIAVGGTFSCARSGDGAVRCWGQNLAGQLGTGAVAARGLPARVIGLADVAQLALGAQHACARLGDGTVRCWGDNRAGQVGDGTRDGPRTTPGAVPGLAEVAEVAASGDHTCARRADGSVWCWGNNFYGELGDGTRIVRATPTRVEGLGRARQLALAGGSAYGGGHHSCARLEDATVWCWGGNRYGQLGDGSLRDRLRPVRVAGLTDVEEIAAGVHVFAHGAHTCARLAAGEVRCWGSDLAGQLGTGTVGHRLRPAVVRGLTDVAEVTAGGRTTDGFACARTAAGSVYCWGSNHSGQLGDGTTTARAAPVAVVGLADVTAVAAGVAHVCALLRDATARCWGNNSAGQVGDAMRPLHTRPVVVPGLADVAQIAVGAGHSCARLVDGTVRCWGANGNGQLGDGTTVAQARPVAVAGLRDVAGIALAGNYSCAWLRDGTARCWGYGGDGCLGDGTRRDQSAPVAVRDLSDVVALSAGTNRACARRRDGAGHCWGIVAASYRPSPEPEAHLASATQVVLGEYHTCVQRADGTACWGINDCGQLGDGSTAARTVPTAVVDLVGGTQLAAAGRLSCARLVDGTARCWGSNASGEVGDGTDPAHPTPLAARF